MTSTLIVLAAILVAANSQAPTINSTDFYYLANQATGMVMDATGCQGGSCKMVVNAKQPLVGQLWQVQQVPNTPNYIITNLATGSCLNDPGSSNTAGTQMVLYGCSAGSASKNEMFSFIWHAESADPGWQITLLSNSNSVDLASATAANGTAVEFHKDNGNTTASLVQRWSLVSLC